MQCQLTAVSVGTARRDLEASSPGPLPLLAFTCVMLSLTLHSHKTWKIFVASEFKCNSMMLCNGGETGDRWGCRILIQL